MRLCWCAFELYFNFVYFKAWMKIYVLADNLEINERLSWLGRPLNQNYADQGSNRGWIIYAISVHILIREIRWEQKLSKEMCLLDSNLTYISHKLQIYSSQWFTRPLSPYMSDAKVLGFANCMCLKKEHFSKKVFM